MLRNEMDGNPDRWSWGEKYDRYEFQAFHKPQHPLNTCKTLLSICSHQINLLCSALFANNQKPLIIIVISSSQVKSRPTHALFTPSIFIIHYCYFFILFSSNSFEIDGRIKRCPRRGNPSRRGASTETSVGLRNPTPPINGDLTKPGPSPSSQALAKRRRPLWPPYGLKRNPNGFY